MLDLTDPAVVGHALDSYAVRQHPPRGDEQYLHVADLPKCDLETWARRRSHDDYDPRIDAATARKFTDGFDIENRVLDALNERGAGFQRGVRVALSIGGFASIHGHVVSEGYIPNEREAIGHPDGVASDTVLEVKSTVFHTNPPTYEPEIPDLDFIERKHRQYLWQGAAYALALDRPHGLIIDECRSTGEQARVQFNPAKYEGELVRRLLDAQHNTTQDARPQPTLHAWTINPRTGLSWLCKYCRFFGCELNRAKRIAS